MRPYSDVLTMWRHYGDRDLFIWQWEYERLWRRELDSEQAEYILQDLNAITQVLQERRLM